MKRKIIILLFSLLIVFSSALIFLFTNSEENDHNGSLVLSNLNNSSFDIKINNSSPLTDSLGKKIKESSDGKYYGEFSVSASDLPNGKVDYEIYIKNINSTNSISTNYVKILLTDSKNKNLLGYKNGRVLTFNDLKVSNNNLDSKQLYKATIKDGQVHTYKLRMWLSDTYNVTNENLEFKINLFVKIVK